MGLKKICPRCGKIIDSSKSYCDRCSIVKQKNLKKNRKHYDIVKRDKETYELYHSKEWKKIRDIIFVKYKYLDLYEYVINNRIVMANTVHHIIELKEDWNKRLDDNNLIPISEATHNRIHKLYDKDKEGTQQMLLEILVEANKLLV